MKIFVLAILVVAADARGRRGVPGEALLVGPPALSHAPLLTASPSLGVYVADHFAPDSLYSAPLLDPHLLTDPLFNARSVHSSPILDSSLLSSPLYSSVYSADPLYSPSVHSPLLPLPPLLSSYDPLLSSSPYLVPAATAASAASAAPAAPAAPAAAAKSVPAPQAEHRSESKA